MKQITAIALSGGIDSLAAAYLLKQQGHPVTGIHFITGFETGAIPSLNNRFADIADQLDISVKIIDISADFKLKVVDYFTQTYLSGKTPNPCLVCNPSIKFGTLFSFARKLGASRLATGHYARISADSKGRFHLFRGVDRKKDQSYFLAFMSQKQLARACFPLGKMTKSAVKKLAQERGLRPQIKNESQDICFIKDNKYGNFLVQQQDFKAKPGDIVDTKGNILGRHNGLHLFTIGQRRGINCPAAEPYYVVRLDINDNRLVVGLKKDLLSSSCRVSNINWITDKPSAPLDVDIRLRYRHEAARSRLIPQSSKSAMCIFETPQSAVTPGQGAVFYKEDEVIGGGWIDA